MKRILTIVTILLTGLLLVSCGGKREEPTLDVPLDLTVYQGIETDISEYVESKDQDGNDLNETIKIDSEDESIEVSGSFITANELGSFIIEVTVNDLKDETLKTSKKIFVDVLESDEVVEGEKTTYTFERLSEESLNGFKALAGEEEQDLDIQNGELIYREGLKNSKIVKELTLEENSTYKVSLALRADKDLDGVIISILDEENEIKITEDLTSYSIEVFVTEDAITELVLDLGNNENYNLYIERLVVEFEGEFTEESLDLSKFTYINETGESDAVLEENKAKITITKPSVDGWHQKLILSGMTLEKNKTYFLNYTIKSTEDIRFVFVGRTRHQEVEDIGYYVWSDPSVEANKERHIKQSFRTNDFDVEEFEVYFELGYPNTGVIEITDIELNYYDKFEEETTRFSGVTDLGSYEHEDASASMYIDTESKALVYEVEKFGELDWYNKVFIEDAVFKDDSRYRVEFTAKADKEIQFFFAVNPHGKWEPKISEILVLKDEYQTFTFETDSFQTFTQSFEILFQFGDYNTGSAKIMFESIEITQLVRK